MIRPPPCSTLFPYTTLFRSIRDPPVGHRDLRDRDIDLLQVHAVDRKSTRLNSSHVRISYAVFCLKKKKKMRSYRSHCHHSPTPFRPLFRLLPLTLNAYSHSY